MSYRRYKKYRSKVVKMRFQSFFDISTDDGSMQIISVNAGGDDVLKRLAPFFGAYKYYKLGGVSFKLIPASTLPVDPTGLSYEEGENTVDPRDQLTPGMCRITNGEDILEDLNGVTEEQQHALYDNMLLDPRWYKFMLQSGVKRYGTPRYWTIGQLHQDKWPGATMNYPVLGPAGTDTADKIVSTGHKTNVGRLNEAGTAIGAEVGVTRVLSSRLGLFQTGHRGKLGWLPTDDLQLFQRTSAAGGNIYDAFITSIPEIELFKILLPPAYKTKYYYRAFITETVYFRDPIVMNVNGYRALDTFRYEGIPQPAIPTSQATPFTDAIIDIATGGNDGSD